MRGEDGTTTPHDDDDEASKAGGRKKASKAGDRKGGDSDWKASKPDNDDDTADDHGRVNGGDVCVGWLGKVSGLQGPPTDRNALAATSTCWMKA